MTRSRFLALTLVISCGIFLIIGSSAKKNWVATGGSRADGTVELSYELGAFEVPKVDDDQGLKIAIERCRAWGYSGAEEFGGQTKVCNSGGGSCTQWLVTKKYQCLGHLEQ